MVCCCSSSTPAVPCSLAGAKIWITERRMGSCVCRRRRNSASAMAAGCAITCTRRLARRLRRHRPRRARLPADRRIPPSARAAGRRDALRRRTERSISGISPSASSMALRLASGNPARNTARAPDRLLALSFTGHGQGAVFRARAYRAHRSRSGADRSPARTCPPGRESRGPSASRCPPGQKGRVISQFDAPESGGCGCGRRRRRTMPPMRMAMPLPT